MFNKINAYSLQDKGFDTVEANRMLGFNDDERTYEIVAFILDDFNIKHVQLLTNNPNKLQFVENISVVNRLPIVSDPNPHNIDYLSIKKKKMGHLL